MWKRIAAIAFIFLCTSAAWLILGGTILMRTDSLESRLRGRVQSVWGVAQTQEQPVAEYDVTSIDKRTLPPTSSDIEAGLRLEYRQKGLLWYSAYKVAFRGDYEFRNTTPAKQTLRLVLPLPAAQAIYDDLQFVVDGTPRTPLIDKQRAYVPLDAEPDQTLKLHVSYRSQGLDSWRYSFGQDVNPVSNFHLRMTTDFRDIDFPDNTLAPAEKKEIAGGWQLDWNYRNLLSGYEIALAMPEKLQPGPLASQISFFAPVSLFFFFFVLLLITTLRHIDLHPINYFFLAGAFFAFHLLLAYLVDHVDIWIAFLTAAAVSVFLVISYLRLVAGMNGALREAATAQVLYLVLFSLAFFFKGFTGLAITIGAVVTLFVAMRTTGRIRWSERLAPR
ncbi:MAG TPA: inner membrane CreD family protein [Bryobacteraceae bacterium]|jgi:hypothetical protein